ncbi:hypothetical protein CAPTEDRAFT_220023 [Capitella teleta]|uniref:Uncharacterized protein n=1 Tax=Capitella teleta TaxID=283909 RepID=R7UUR9_CAPTE|nr:hypothetical protein CAPTEDRAFT_220023 [Capitella teleta]|eukprot:ELU07116.1 hypothetical protein CAPTEDRAFT_220023 [Capitella teleta]
MTYAQVKQRPSEKNKRETLPPLVNAPSGHLRPDLQSPRPETPFSEIDGEDLQEMFLSVVSLVEEQDKLEEKRQRSLQRGEATEHRVVVETHQIPVGQQSYLNAAFQPDDGAAEKPRQKKIPPKVEKKPSKSSKQQQKVDYKNVRNQFEARKGSGSSEEQSGRIVVNRKNDHPPPRAVVQPTMKESPSPLVTGNIVQVTITENDLVDRRASTVSVSKIEAIEDVPEDLDGLTVSDVCQCLRLLNMDSHVKHFQKHQVDGGLLADMKEKVLTDEFKFTPFNASKLMRFARGWRPKLV